MNWKLIENKKPKGPQDARVKHLLLEMTEYSFATYAGQFESQFKRLVKELPRTNSFSADLMFRVTQRNLKSVEVWKVTPEGDFKHKMWTLNYIGNT